MVNDVSLNAGLNCFEFSRVRNKGKEEEEETNQPHAFGANHDQNCRLFFGVKRLPRVRRRYMGSQGALKYLFRGTRDYSTGSQPSFVTFPADDLTHVVLHIPITLAFCHNESPKDANAGFARGSRYYVGKRLTSVSEQGTVRLIWLKVFHRVPSCCQKVKVN